jgi:hypothetical protein
MLLEKKTLSLEEVEAQTALELPEREMMAPLVVITGGPGGILSGNTINIPVTDVNVGADICANVIASDPSFSCDVTQE